MNATEILSDRIIHTARNLKDTALRTVRENAPRIKIAAALAFALTAGSLFYAPQQPLPFFLQTADAASPRGDPNDKNSINFRGWEAHMVTDNDHRHAQIVSEGKFPPLDCFHLFGDYYAKKPDDAILFRNGWISATGGGKGLLTQVDIVNSGGQVVGQGTMYRMYDGQPDSFSGSLTLDSSQ